MISKEDISPKSILEEKKAVFELKATATKKGIYSRGIELLHNSDIIDKAIKVGDIGY